MRNLLLFSITLVFLFPVSVLKSQKLVRNSSVTGVSYASNKVNKIYIPPPKEFYEKSGRKGGASFSVTYINCPVNVIKAVNYADSILVSILPGNIKVSMVVIWKKITTSGVLANSSTSYYIAGWTIDAFKPFAYYPAALAEKIAGEPMNRNADSDLVLNINNSVNWYTGTDGKTTFLKYDLVTVVLHEICHGLGFIDSFQVEGTNGLYGSLSIPLIYDTFVESLGGTNLTDTTKIQNPSTNLKTLLTSGQIWFDGPLTGSRAKLYAPSAYDAGSSIAHLDPTVTSEKNSLMTPYIDMEEAIHDPGKLTLSILGDLGWINTSIIHKVPEDTEEHLSEIKIEATIKSDTTYNHDRVGVVWSFDNFRNIDTLFMASSGLNNNYTVTLPVTSYETKLQYYIFVEDKFLRVFRYPSFIDEFKNEIYIGTDTVKPQLVHTPEKYYFERIDSIKFNALATDNLGVDTVYIEYIINDGITRYAGLEHKKDFEYSGFLIPRALDMKGGDSIRYRLVAVDKSSAANSKILPSTGFFTVLIEHLNNVSNGYTTDFSGVADDFVNDGFVIDKPNGFSTWGLSTPHPYVSPEESGDSIGYTATLRTPVKFDINGMIISFREVVLVEPGEDDYPFGTTDFYDYVIVEGSRNFGKSWFKLTDGYDCRYKEPWVSAYNSSIDGQNSKYIGDESLLQNHTIFPAVTTDIAAGDTLMVRFRLFSDPYANGWGWIIENLHIGALINKVEEIDDSPLTVYPNPGNGLITLRTGGVELLEPVRFSVFNSAGICVMNGTTTGGGEQQLDISRFSSGLYFIVFDPESRLKTVKYTLIR